MGTQEINNSIYYLVFLGSGGGLLLALSVVFFYVRYQRRFIQQQADIQKAALEHKAQLLGSVIQSQENERIRISKELHDHVGATLSSLRFLVSRITQQGAEPGAIKNIAEESKASIDRIIEDVRNISHSLSPAGLELWGFHEALGEYCDKTGRSSGHNIQVNDNSGGILRQLMFDDALSLFRVLQELLTNTIKHAAAKNVTIGIDKTNDTVIIKYTDDGKGIDMSMQAKHGIGLYNIESRLSVISAGYEVVSAPGAGYSFIIKLQQELLDKKQGNG